MASSTFDLKYKSVTNCPDPAILDFAIVVEPLGGGTALETFTVASAASTTAGVTYTPPATVGGLPLVQVDETLLAQDIQITYVDFTTSCGTAAVGDVAEFEVDAGTPSGTPGGNVGCVLFSGGGIIDIPDRDPFENRTVGTTVFITGDGRLAGAGKNISGGGIGAGIFGVPAAGTAVPDPNIPWRASDFEVARALPNYEFYEPNTRFTHVASVPGVNSSIVYAVTDDGRLLGHGNGNNASKFMPGSPYAAANGDTTASPADAVLANKPVEIPSPNGQPWVDVIMRSRTEIYACAGTQWYSWGGPTGDGPARLAHRLVPGTAGTGAAVTEYQPKACVWPVQPLAGDAKNTWVYAPSGVQAFIAQDGTIRVWGGARNFQMWGTGPGTGFNEGDAVNLPAGVTPVKYFGHLSSVQEFTSFLGDDGNVYSFIDINSGDAAAPLGGAFPAANNFTAVMTPPAPAPGFSDISVNESGDALAIGTDGELYRIGYSDVIAVPDFPGPIQYISFGMEALVVDGNGDLFPFRIQQNGTVLSSIQTGYYEMIGLIPIGSTGPFKATC